MKTLDERAAAEIGQLALQLMKANMQNEAHATQIASLQQALTDANKEIADLKAKLDAKETPAANGHDAAEATA